MEFFFSGFGVMKNFLNKNDYLKGFLKKRLITVLVPFYLINTIYGILFYKTRSKYLHQLNPLCVEKKNHTLKNILTTFLGYTPAFESGWYIISISLLYIVFYITFKLSNIIELIFLLFLFIVMVLFYMEEIIKVLVDLKVLIGIEVYFLFYMEF